MPSKIFRRFLVALVALAIVACSSGDGATTTVDQSNFTPTSTSDSGPGSTTTPTGPTTTTTLPEDNPLVQAELTVEVDGATILFDQRPFTLLDGSGRVQVIGPNDEILAEGPFDGADSIMTQLPDGSFEFVNAAGSVVARMTQQQLFDAMDAATTG